MGRESSMSRAEYFSKTPPVFTRLAVRLRMIPAVAFLFARFAALLRGNSGRGEPLTSEFSGEAPDATSDMVDQDAAVSKPSGIQAIPEPEINDRSEREKLIRRRWTETGIMMWNPDVHGAGR